jgi:hypothetical protein
MKADRQRLSRPIEPMKDSDQLVFAYVPGARIE